MRLIVRRLRRFTYDQRRASNLRSIPVVGRSLSFPRVYTFVNPVGNLLTVTCRQKKLSLNTRRASGMQKIYIMNFITREHVEFAPYRQHSPFRDTQIGKSDHTYTSFSHLIGIKLLCTKFNQRYLLIPKNMENSLV